METTRSRGSRASLPLRSFRSRPTSTDPHHREARDTARPTARCPAREKDRLEVTANRRLRSPWRRTGSTPRHSSCSCSLPIAIATVVHVPRPLRPRLHSRRGPRRSGGRRVAARRHAKRPLVSPTRCAELDVIDREFWRIANQNRHAMEPADRRLRVGVRRHPALPRRRMAITRSQPRKPKLDCGSPSAGRYRRGKGPAPRPRPPGASDPTAHRNEVRDLARPFLPAARLVPRRKRRPDRALVPRSSP